MKVTKHSVLFLLMVFFNLRGISQIPQAINYQAVARSNNGIALAAKAIKIRVSILQGSATGQIVYQETHDVTTDNAGAFSLKVGLGSSTSGTFNQINWSNGDKYIQSEFDFNDGSGFQLSGTSQILSVPFALYAGNGSKWKIKSDSSTYYNSGKVGIRTTTPRSFLDVISNEGNSQYTLNLSSTHSQGQAGLAAWNDNGGWLKMSLLGSQVTDGAAFGQTGEGTVQILSNMTGARDMLLGTLNNQSLLLGTNNLPRLTIKNDGRIGIGTTSPNQVLSVNGLIESTNGGIKFPDGTTQSTAALGPSQWKITHGGSNYSKARLWEGDSSKFPLDNYSQIVSVHSNSLGYPISTYNTDPAGMSAIAHWIEDTNGLSAGWLLSGINGVSSTGTSWGIPNAKLSAILGRGGDFIIGPVTSNKSLYLLGGGSPQVVVSGNGNVGIGAYSTNLPNARLQVQNGDVYLENIGSGLILKSPSGQCWRITIDDSGNLVRTAITCP